MRHLASHIDGGLSQESAVKIEWNLDLGLKTLDARRQGAEWVARASGRDGAAPPPVAVRSVVPGKRVIAVGCKICPCRATRLRAASN